MHIVHTEASCGWGGQELRILNEARGMLERGHRVTLLTPRIAQIFDAAEDMGLTVQAMPLEQKSLANMRVLRRWFRDNPVDVINTHSSIDSWLSAVARIGLKPRLPIVRTRHISAPISRSITSRWLYRSGADRVVTTGESLRLDLVDRTGIDPARIVSIPTGTDTDRFSPIGPARTAAIRASFDIPADAVVIGIAATLRSWKGHDYLLTAFERLCKSHPALHLLIAGDGPRRTKIDRARRESQCSERIHLLGHRNDVPDILAAMDIFALPSYANEGIPQAILQAMAMHKPVVTTRVGAIEDAVINQQTGLFVEPQDADDLAEKIQRLMEDPELCRKLGDAGRRRIETDFSFGQMIDRMEQLFLEAIEA